MNDARTPVPSALMAPRPWQRSRGAVWLSALLMVVLLAGFGLPMPAVGLAGPATVAASAEGAARSSYEEALGGRHRVPWPRAAHSPALPRAVPRTRMVQTRGLPPPRAP